jgi:hypothetical protein
MPFLSFQLNFETHSRDRCLTAASCDYTIFPGLGVTHHAISTSDNQKICLNFTIFPTFLVVNNFERDTLYYEYSAQLETETLQEQFYTEIRFLDVFRAILSPFSAPVIRTPTDCNVSFSTAVLPGMCGDGIFFSNLPTDIVEFSSNGTGFFRLENFIDRCIIFSTHARQQIQTSITSLDNFDQLFVYRNWTDFSSICGNDTTNSTSLDDTHGVIVRLVTDDQLPPIAVSVMMQSGDVMPRFFQPRSVHSKSRSAGMQWNHTSVWRSDGDGGSRGDVRARRRGFRGTVHGMPLRNIRSSRIAK